MALAIRQNRRVNLTDNCILIPGRVVSRPSKTPPRQFTIVTDGRLEP